MTFTHLLTKLLRIQLPPLRDRRQDIIEIATSFMNYYNKAMGKNIKDIDADAKNILYNYNYPGNVRELKNIIERVVLFSDGKKITSKHLSNIIPSANEIKNNSHEDSNITLEEMEKRHIMKVLTSCNENKTEAAKRLGIARSTLNLKIDGLKKNTAHNFMITKRQSTF